MHVLIVSHNYPFKLDQTFGFFCKNQADALVKVGQQVGILCPLLYSLKHVLTHKKLLISKRTTLTDGVQEYIFVLPSIPKLRYFILNLLGRWMVDRYIKKYGKPDVVHLHVYVAGGIALYLKRKYSVPVIYTEHFTSVKYNQLSHFETTLLEKVARQATRRIAVSLEFKSILQKIVNLPFDYLPNVYDSTIFEQKKRKIRNARFVFLHVAHINGRKNQRRLLEAFYKAFADDQNVSLKIIGFGADKPAFLGLIKKLKLEGRVTTHGSLSPAEVASQMQHADAFVMSSDYETFGVSIIEAMACGLPVVSTRCGGPESIIINDKLGILTEQTPTALADGMAHVYSNIAAFTPEYISGYAYNKFSLQAIGKKLVEIYSQSTSETLTSNH